MEGEHLLDSKGLVRVVINNADNLTLRGERGRSNTDIIIRCSSNTHGLVFNNSNIININGIIIARCGQQDIIPLLFINIASLYIHHVTLCNNIYSTNNSVTGGALYIHSVNNTHIAITNSAFTNNIVDWYGGGLVIYTEPYAHSNITITNSTFTNNRVRMQGGGLYIITDTDTHNNITITNSAFTNNTVGIYVGGGLYIKTYTDSCNNNITITNSAFTNNIAPSGGGLFIIADSEHNYITITKCVFTNNTVDDTGGGIYILGGTGTQNNINITNSAFTNNTVGENGGGLYIYTESDVHNNITITNSAFTNNIVNHTGGGLYKRTDIDTYNSITITNSVFTNNIVGQYGGGLYIHVYTGTDAHNNITITNSELTSNTVGQYGGGLYIQINGMIIENILTIAISTFANNGVSGISAINNIKVIFTEGHSIVANNSSPTDGGGIFLAENSYLTTSNGGHVSFINNTAHRYGGAIYSADNDYTLLRYDTLDKEYSDQCTVYNLLATFINNSAAIAGDYLYGGVLTLCKGYYFRQQYLQYLLHCDKVPDILKHATSVHQCIHSLQYHPIL